MPGITGQVTTFNAPNYTGEILALSPAETPLTTYIGGLTGGKESTAAKETEWQTYDLRAPGQNTALEGADAPTANGRDRQSVSNVLEIHHETVEVSYTKSAAWNQFAGLNIGGDNPIKNELTWQIAQELKQIKLDIEYSFINGAYAKPADNATPRKTRGLLAAMTSNVFNKGADVITTVPTDTGDKFAATAHGLVNGEQVIFDTIVTTTGFSEDTVYYVVGKTTNDFQIALTLGGSAVVLTTNGTANVRKSVALGRDDILELGQSIWDNGGITEEGTATIICGSSQKLALSEAFANAFGKFHETSRSVAGVNVNTVVTDLGTFNVMLSRVIPKHKLILASLEQLAPVFLKHPEKGHLYAEPLAKAGSADKVQIYGEVGLEYGNEAAHGYLTGLKV